MGFHRRTLRFEWIKNYGISADDFRSFDRFMIGADSYSFGDNFSAAIWGYYSLEDENSRMNFWIALSESPIFFDELYKCYEVLNHPKNLPIHADALNRYVNLLRIKWAEDPYKFQIINFIHGSAKSNY